MAASSHRVSGVILTNAQQYSHELASLPRMSTLSQQDKETLVQLARAGDQQAKERIIEALLHSIRSFAKKLYAQYGWEAPRLEYLDIIAAGNLAVVETFERGLQKYEPFGYLFAVACGEMYSYCFQYRSLLSVPHGSRIDEAFEIVSGDAPYYKNSERTLFEVVDIASPQEERENHQGKEHPKLYEALETLSARQQTVIIRHFGLYDHPCEDFQDLEQDLFDRKGSTAIGHYQRALLKLYRLVHTHYPHYTEEKMYLLQEQRVRRTPIQKLTQEQERRLQQAHIRLQEQGQKVSVRTLQKEAHIKSDVVKSYLYQLRQHQPEPTRYERLEQAYLRLQASGSVSVKKLAKAAHVEDLHASLYLHTRQQASQQQACQSRA